MLGHNAVYVPGWDCHGLPIEHQVDKELGLDTASLDVRRAMDPLEKIGRCREYAARYIDIQQRGVQAPRRLRRLGAPVRDDGARVPGDDRARVRPVRRPRHRLQGPEARRTGACTARRRWPRPRSSTRTSTRPSVYVKFPVNDGAPRPRAAALGGGAPRWSSGRPRRGPCRPTSPSRCTPTRRTPPSSWTASCSSSPGGLAPAVLELRLEGSGGACADQISGEALAGTRRRHPWIDRDASVLTADCVAWTRAPVSCTSRPATARRTTSWAGRSGCTIYNPVDDDGRFVPRSSASPGSRCGMRIRRSSST